MDNRLRSPSVTRVESLLVGVSVRGRTATDLSDNSGFQSVTESTDAIFGLAIEGPGHGSGRFVDRNGEVP